MTGDGVADMEIGMVADELANIVVHMKVDKVAAMVIDITDVTMAIGDRGGDGGGQ